MTANNTIHNDREARILRILEKFDKLSSSQVDQLINALTLFRSLSDDGKNQTLAFIERIKLQKGGGMISPKTMRAVRNIQVLVEARSKLYEGYVNDDTYLRVNTDEFEKLRCEAIGELEQAFVKAIKTEALLIE